MDHFQYRNGTLWAEDVALSTIVEAVGTPFYCYSTATLTRHYNVFTEALAGLPALVCYSVKANSNLAVIKTLAGLGAGVDVVSGGELMRAMRAGVPADRIVFSGVGKTAPEISAALEAGILQINIESEPELALVNDVAARLGLTAPIAIRINPDIDADTHDKISTGRSEDKFGIEWTRVHEVVTRSAGLDHIQVVGLAMHIGSQLTSLDPFRDAFQRLSGLVTDLRTRGVEIQRLDLGGGLGIPYDDSAVPEPAAYGQLVREMLGDLDCRLLFEPGRLIVGNAGILVTKVVYLKEGATRNFVIVDAAMNDLLRPSLYDARHEIVPLVEPPPGGPEMAADVVGPVCETGDTFATELTMAQLEAGDALAIRSAGAYGAVMASSYNSRALVPEVMVNGEDFAVIRRRITTQDYLDYEDMPDWLEEE
ncbi:MAG: diaminopimelate decarboxylase [Rhodospirillaceae bacterium]|jgi:diaminopimelate decarboxylase|nr:diaminopimelate decarboxylase [Rhodospirillaceae bacterium]MBT3883156.1 diaminopimelate decarboxylase [Rhodospirillaceae bacterium]MBT5181454.1 diaminopimelate decarboxylase [Rhodospirillaceae bacterium]MBT5839685.1 diaminopimelate decarboxylase [Rhodospirillaceae bacterium]MBT7029808.1 diaminopimelate decarboxylase [Rhodospirillaceae bacterium]